MDRHPPTVPLHTDCLISDSSISTVPDYHLVIFDGFDGSVVHEAVLHTSEAAEPSGVDAYGWRHSFGLVSGEFCCSIAILAQRLCTNFVDLDIISPLFACRLIALDKNPGF